MLVVLFGFLTVILFAAGFVFSLISNLTFLCEGLEIQRRKDWIELFFKNLFGISLIVVSLILAIGFDKIAKPYLKIQSENEVQIEKVEEKLK